MVDGQHWAARCCPSTTRGVLLHSMSSLVAPPNAVCCSLNSLWLRRINTLVLHRRSELKPDLGCLARPVDVVDESSTTGNWLLVGFNWTATRPIPLGNKLLRVQPVFLRIAMMTCGKPKPHLAILNGILGGTRSVVYAAARARAPAM